MIPIVRQTVLEGLRGRFVLPFVALVGALLAAGAFLDYLDPALGDQEILLDIGLFAAVLISGPAAIAAAVDLVGRYIEGCEGWAVVIRAGRPRAAAGRLLGAGLVGAVIGGTSGSLLWATATIADLGAEVSGAPLLLAGAAALMALLAGALALVLHRRAALPLALAIFIAGWSRLDAGRLAFLAPPPMARVLWYVAHLVPNLDVFHPLGRASIAEALLTLLLYGGAYIGAGVWGAARRDL